MYKVWPQIEANKNKIIAGVLIIVAVVGIISFISWQREQSQVAAGEALTQTLLDLKPNTDLSQVSHAYLAVAQDHPNTPAGGRALLEGAAVLFTQGKYTDARGYFQQYLDAHPDDEFSAQAALGVAKCYEAENKYNEAAGEYQRVINDFGDAQAQIQARFALGQMSLMAKNYADALRQFQQVAQSDPYGAFGQEAGQYAYELHYKVASQPSPSATAPGATPTTTPAGTPAKAPAAAPTAAPFNLSH